MYIKRILKLFIISIICIFLILTLFIFIWHNLPISLDRLNKNFKDDINFNYNNNVIKITDIFIGHDYEYKNYENAFIDSFVVIFEEGYLDGPNAFPRVEKIIARKLLLNDISEEKQNYYTEMEFSVIKKNIFDLKIIALSKRLKKYVKRNILDNLYLNLVGMEEFSQKILKKTINNANIDELISLFYIYNSGNKIKNYEFIFSRINDNLRNKEIENVFELNSYFTEEKVKEIVNKIIMILNNY